MLTAGPQLQGPLRRNKGFRMLWVGQLLSDTGSQIGGLAYPLLILALTHSAVLAGVMGTTRAITAVCLQLPAGALSDRFDRRLTMIICDSTRAVLLALLGILIVAHLASWPVVLIVSVIEGGAGTIFTPAATAALPGIVTDGQLEQAWAATEARAYGASLAGPALGGVLFGLGQAVPFLADAISYGVSSGTVNRIRGRFRPENATGRKALWREVSDGLQLVWRTPVLRAVAVQTPLVNFSFTGVIFTVTLALRQHGTSTAVIGLVQAAIAAGGLLGAVVAPRLQGRMRLATLATTITLAGAVAFGAAALLVPSPLVAAPVALALLFAPAANAALVAVVLRSAPQDMRGRVTSTVVMAATALATLAPLIAGLLVQHTSGAWAIGAFAATMAIAAAGCLILPGLRQAQSGCMPARRAALDQLSRPQVYEAPAGDAVGEDPDDQCVFSLRPGLEVRAGQNVPSLAWLQDRVRLPADKDAPALVQWFIDVVDLECDRLAGVAGDRGPAFGPHHDGVRDDREVHGEDGGPRRRHQRDPSDASAGDQPAAFGLREAL